MGTKRRRSSAIINPSDVSWWNMIKYFRPGEFDSPDVPASGLRMDRDFVVFLDLIRTDYGKPMHVTSGYRTLRHNIAIRGVVNSAHLRGLAADILCTNSRDRALLLDLAFHHGIRRRGIGKDFLHFDIDPTLPSPAIWLY